MNDDDPILFMEAARLMRLNPRTIDLWIKKGKITPLRMNNKFRYFTWKQIKPYVVDEPVDKNKDKPIA